MKIISYCAIVLGLAAVIALVAWHGFGTVATASAALGAAVLLLPFVYAPHILGAAFSWSRIFAAGARPALPVMVRAVWIGLAVESLAPGASFAAELAKARMLMRAGLSGGDAASGVIVDMTIQGLVLAVWGALGVAALAASQAGADILWTALIGALVLLLAIGALIAAQQSGFFGFLARQGARAIRAQRWKNAVDGAVRLDAMVRDFYGRPRQIVLAVFIRCCSRAMLMVELSLAADLMGHPIAPAAAVMLVGLVGALRAAAFVVPGGWGVQEGGFVVVGGLVGLPPDIMLALSLATRAREVLVGVPALLVWQVMEGRSLKTMIGARSARANPSR